MDQSPDVREEKKFIQVSEGIKKMVLNGCKVLIGDLYVINVMPKVCIIPKVQQVSWDSILSHETN